MEKKNMCNCRDSNPPYDQPVTGLGIQIRRLIYIQFENVIMIYQMVESS